MKLYHMSQTLQLGDTIVADFQKCLPLVQPFVQALERSEDCFYGMVLNGKYLYAMLDKFKLWEWADYAKWATEGAFEFIRQTEFPDSNSRMGSTYLFDNLPDIQRHFQEDWGNEDEEEQEKVHLFEIEAEEACLQKRDMNIFNEAYDAMSETQNIPLVLDCARRYFSGQQSATPAWEILSAGPAKAVADITEQLTKPHT